MGNRYVEECLEQELFVFWPDNEYWVRVSGTNLLFQPNPHDECRRRWYLINEENSHYTLNSPIDKLFSEDVLIESRTGNGHFIDMSIEEIIDLLPEYLQTQLVFNINLVSKG